MRIKLNAAEMMQAALVGVMRELNNIKAGRNHKYGGDKHVGWQMHIEGAMGEMAVAKCLNAYWSSGKRGTEDVANFEVRTTQKPTNRLIIHQDDPDDRRVFLVTGVSGNYEVVGHILASEGKKPQYWEDPTSNNRWAYFIPIDALTRI